MSVPRKLSLALPGAGSHGAVTCGALERLLEEEWFVPDGASGTSSGAMNAVALAHGWSVGGRLGAIRALRELWSRVGELGRHGPYRRGYVDRALDRWNVDASPAAGFAAFFQGFAAPQWCLMGQGNSLREALASTVTVEAVRSSPIRIFLTATEVETGAARIFRNEDFEIDAAMASACLPELFPAVEINGVPHWDGGFVANTSLWPLVRECETRDILVLEVHPLRRPGVPRTPLGIRNRMSEISFSNSLRSEVRALHMLGECGGPSIRFHRIEAEREIVSLGITSRLNAEPEFIDHLRDIGRRAASRWIEANAGDVGGKSSCDVGTVYLGADAPRVAA